MTTVTFRTYGHLTTITQAVQLDLEFEGGTIQDLLHALEARFGKSMTDVLYPREGKLSPLLFILVNGKNIRYLAGMATPIRDGDIVSILPVTAGG